MATKHRPGTTLICPHCGGHDTSRLPGGVVAECLRPDCGWAFNTAAAEVYKPSPSQAADTHLSIPRGLLDRQQELPL